MRPSSGRPHRAYGKKKGRGPPRPFVPSGAPAYMKNESIAYQIGLRRSIEPVRRW